MVSVPVAPFTVTVEMVTPPMAREILDRSEEVEQRTTSELQVRTLMAAIARGEWQLNHQAVAIGPDGKLYDGKHRFTAIARGAVSVPMLIARDVPPEVMSTVDVGKRRSNSDVLHMNGYTNTTVLATAIRHLLLVRQMNEESLTWNSARNRRTVTATEELDFLQKDPMGEVILNQMPNASRIANAWGRFGVRTWMASALTYLVQEGASEGQRLEFTERCIDGAYLKPGSPILALRAFVSTSGQGLYKARSSEWAVVGIASTIRAYNLYATHSDTRFTGWQMRHQFPKVVTPGD